MGDACAECGEHVGEQQRNQLLAIRGGPILCDFSHQGVGGGEHDAGVVLTATNTLMAEIAQDWSTPNGQQLITLLFTDVFPALGAGITQG